MAHTSTAKPCVVQQIWAASGNSDDLSQLRLQAAPTRGNESLCLHCFKRERVRCPCWSFQMSGSWLWRTPSPIKLPHGAGSIGNLDMGFMTESGFFQRGEVGSFHRFFEEADIWIGLHGSLVFEDIG
ncbi:unnamed protein product [Ilex paraguariensis]|uniref:Uncharacterized protein n=1 Tax=Ilex paraguariensis TaxID=185542 RepID=A0ABC8TB51_9AQUA